MGAVVERIADVTAPWGSFYADSAMTETVVMFLHLGAMVAAGGLAFTLDRAVLRADRYGGPDEKLARELHGSHRAVVGGLLVIVLTGVALTVSDPDVFLVSWIYWAKMAAVVLLLVNGVFLKRSGERLLATPGDEAAFRRLKTSAVRSTFLWGFTVLAGVAITIYV